LDGVVDDEDAEEGCVKRFAFGLSFEYWFVASTPDLLGISLGTFLSKTCLVDVYLSRTSWIFTVMINAFVL
jgi:hypothetical protein